MFILCFAFAIHGCFVYGPNGGTCYMRNNILRVRDLYFVNMLSMVFLLPGPYELNRPR